MGKPLYTSSDEVCTIEIIAPLRIGHDPRTPGPEQERNKGRNTLNSLFFPLALLQVLPLAILARTRGQRSPREAVGMSQLSDT